MNEDFVVVTLTNGILQERIFEYPSQIVPTISAQTVQPVMGRRKGGATGHSKEKHDASPRSYIQKSYDSPITVPESDILVSWYVDGNTQIHIASADFQTAKFDVVILPLKYNMIGISIFPTQNGTRNYGSFFQRPLHPGQIMTSCKTGELACKTIEAGLFSDRNTKENQDTIDKIVKKLINKKKKQEIVRTIAIPVKFDGLYDPIDFVTSIVQKRNNMEQIACFLCFNGKEPDMVPFMKRVNEFLGTRQSPRRLVISRYFKDLVFLTINVSIEIKIQGIVNAGCECIVAAIGGNYKLDASMLTKSIAEAAGTDLQRSIDKLNKDAYQFGDVIYCDSFKLSTKGVKSILFGRLTKWEKRQGPDKNLVREVSNFVKECLLTADDNGCKSVAFPVLGSGYLNYPEDIIVTSLLRGIDKYTSGATKGNVSRVVIAYFDGEDNDSLYQKFESGITRRRPRMEYGAELAASSDPQNSGSMDDRTNDESEMLYGEVTAEVNPGIREYLFVTKRIEEFKSYFSKEFDVQVDDTGGKLVLKGTLTNIIKAEDNIATGPMFDDADKGPSSVEEPMQVNTSMNCNNCPQNSHEEGASSLEEPMPVNPSVNCDTPSQNTHEGDQEVVAQGSGINTTMAHEQAQPKTDKHQVANVKTLGVKMPTGIEVNRFDIPEFHKSLHVFNTDNLFSFETDIKVVTTDKKFSQKNQFLTQVLEKIPECQKMWEKCEGKDCDEMHLEMVNLIQHNKCSCIIVAVTLNVEKSIQKKENEKIKLKKKINTMIQNIMAKAEEMKVQSITLPLLVETGNDSATNVCCNSMAEAILKYLKQEDTLLEHVNVLLDSERTRKIFYGAVKNRHT